MPEEKKEELRPFISPRVLPTKVESITQGQETVTMVFPKRTLLFHNGVQIEFTQGVHEVPADLANHWYLKANGALRHDRPEPISLPDDSEEFEEVEEEVEDSTPADPKPRKRVKRRRRKKALEKPVEQAPIEIDASYRDGLKE